MFLWKNEWKFDNEVMSRSFGILPRVFKDGDKILIREQWTPQGTNPTPNPNPNF